MTDTDCDETGGENDVPTILHQFRVRKRPWSHWKALVDLATPVIATNGEYARIGDRLNELITLDYACNLRHDAGVIELALDIGLVSEADLERVWDGSSDPAPDVDLSGLDAPVDETAAEPATESDADADADAEPADPDGDTNGGTG